MKKLLVTAWLPMLFVLMAERTNAQAIFEYGKQTEAVKGIRPGANPKSIKTPSANRKTVNPLGESEAPANSSGSSIPAVLAVKQSDAYLYARQDDHSDVIAKLEQGVKLIPVGKAFGNGQTWYMVKTHEGAIGWTVSSAVEELSENKQQLNKELPR